MKKIIGGVTYYYTREGAVWYMKNKKRVYVYDQAINSKIFNLKWR